MRDNLSE